MPGRWELLATRPGGTVTSLAAGGSAVFAATPAGLRCSTDGGRSWTVLGGNPAPSIELVAPSPVFASDATLLGGTADGLLRSTDGGQSWQKALMGSRVLAVAFSPAFGDDGLVLVGTEQDGLLRSNDRGHTWTSGNPGLLDLTVLGLVCSPAFDVDHIAFAATASGLFRSSNAGRAWRAIETLPGEQAVQCVALSPQLTTDPIVCAGTEADGLLRSTDGGLTWHSVEEFAKRSVTALAWPSVGTLAAASDTGVMASGDGGATWSPVGHELRRVLSVAFAPDGALLAGMPREGVARSADFVRWETANAGLLANLVVAIAVSPEFERDQSLYVAGLEDGVAISTNAGASWESASTGLGGDTAVFGLAAGLAGVFAATSAGIFRRHWETVGDWERVHPAAARAVRAVGHRVVAVGMQNELFESSDGGASWQSLAWLPPANQPISVALAATLAELVGVAWGQVSLPGAITALEFSPAYRQDGTVLAGSSTGIHISRDAGVTFHPLNAGLGNVPVVAVAFSPGYATDRQIYAVELGGRIWRSTCASR